MANVAEAPRPVYRGRNVVERTRVAAQFSPALMDVPFPRILAVKTCEV